VRSSRKTSYLLKIHLLMENSLLVNMQMEETGGFWSEKGSAFPAMFTGCYSHPKGC
jgi:hypothetical protein